MMRIRTGLLPGLLLALAVGACGGGGGNNSGVASLGGAGSATSTTRPGGSQDKQQAALNWARCMRQQGINLPDPQFSGDNSEQLPRGVDPNSPKFKAAEQACKQYQRNGAQAPPSAQERQQALAFARCMRQHGINLPDPTFSRNGGIRLQGPPKSDGTGPDHPKFKAALQACNKYLKYLPNGGRKPTDRQLLAFARCMRQHGVDLPDPGPRGGIDLRANGVNPESPTFKAAEPVCWRSSGFRR